jgi:hypothetical protein
MYVLFCFIFNLDCILFWRCFKTIHCTQIYILVHNKKWEFFVCFQWVHLGHSSLQLLEFDKLHISFCIKKFKLQRGWKEKVVWSSQSQLILFTIHQHCIRIDYQSFSQLTFKEKKRTPPPPPRRPITLRSPQTTRDSTVRKPLVSRGAPSWFHNILTYNGEVIEYWTIFLLKIHSNQN